MTKTTAVPPKSKFIQELATTKKKKDRNLYINNAEFLQAIIDYKQACKDAKKAKKPKPPITNFIGKCLMQIADNLSHKGNFSGYSFVDEMKSDGIENCIQYFNNFDPKKSKYAFTYFTKIIYWAFVRRIQKEKKQLYIKYKATQQMGILDENVFEGEDGQRIQVELYENQSDFIGRYEDAQNASKKKQANKTANSKVNLELLVED